MSMKYFKIFMALEPFSATHFNGYLGIWDNRTEEIFKRISFFKVLRFWLYLHFCFSITFLRFLISQFEILTCTCVYSMFTGMCKYNFFVLRCASSPCGTLRRKKKKNRMGNKKHRTPFRKAEFVHMKRNGFVFFLGTYSRLSHVSVALNGNSFKLWGSQSDVL